MKPIENFKFQAIQELYPNVVTVRGDTAFDENENEVAIDETAVESKKEELQTAEANAITEKETLKASAKAKLIAGEALTEDEANTIVL
jgi:hypothetical protein